MFLPKIEVRREYVARLLTNSGSNRDAEVIISVDKSSADAKEFFYNQVLKTAEGFYPIEDGWIVLWRDEKRKELCVAPRSGDPQESYSVISEVEDTFSVEFTWSNR